MRAVFAIPPYAQGSNSWFGDESAPYEIYFPERRGEAWARPNRSIAQWLDEVNCLVTAEMGEKSDGWDGADEAARRPHEPVTGAADEASLPE